MYTQPNYALGREARAEILTTGTITDDQFQAVTNALIHPDWQRDFLAATDPNTPFKGPTYDPSRYTVDYAVEYQPIYLHQSPYTRETVLVGWAHPDVDLSMIEVRKPSWRQLPDVPFVFIGQNVHSATGYTATGIITIYADITNPFIYIHNTTVVERLQLHSKALIINSRITTLTARENHSEDTSIILESCYMEAGTSLRLNTHTYFENVNFDHGYVTFAEPVAIAYVLFDGNATFRNTVKGTASDEDRVIVKHAAQVQRPIDLSRPADQLLLSLGVMPDAKGHVVLYKRVHSRTWANLGDGVYSSCYDEEFTYTIGRTSRIEDPETARQDKSSCAAGLHLSHPHYWNEGDTLLACQFHIDDLIVALDGKCRVTKVKTLWAQDLATGKYATKATKAATV